MSAAARAEARRKAILGRGTDRLAKLTTSARGEDAPAYLHDDPPLPSLSKSFVGEESLMPNPSSRLSSSPSPSPSPSPARNRTPAPDPHPVQNPFAALGLGPNSGTGAPDPSVWSQEQQQQFMQALMGGVGGAPPLPGQPRSLSTDDPPMPAFDGLENNPLAAMLFPQGMPGGAGPGMGMGAFGPAAGSEVQQEKPPTRLQKLMPFVHMVAMWVLLAYFVLYREPLAHDAVVGSVDYGEGPWRRWAVLGKTGGGASIGDVLRVQFVPFFWAFTTLQIALHSLRIFSGFDVVKPPMMLSFVLPHLPPPFPSIIINGLKYFQMGSLFLDDLAALVVGLGFIVFFAGWFTS